MKIYSKLQKIQSTLKAPKNQHNDFGKYNYRSCEDILDAVKPLLNAEGLVLIMSDEIVQIAERVYVKSTAKLIDVDSGECVENVALAREEESKKGMDGCQITGASSSYARKYALNGLFIIDDTKDSDVARKNTQAVKTITEAQKSEIVKYGINLEEVAKYFKVRGIDEIPFDKAKALIAKKEREANNAG